MRSGEILFLAVFAISVFSFASLAPWVPTRRKDFERIAGIVGLRDGERFLEIGCGTAGVSLYMARKHPSSKITGIELSPFFYAISKTRAAASGLKNVEILFGNALNLDLGAYDAVYVFGLPDTVTKKVFPKIRNVGKNFRLFSYCFKMTNDRFMETVHKPDGELSVYEYRLPDSAISDS